MAYIACLFTIFIALSAYQVTCVPTFTVSPARIWSGDSTIFTCSEPAGAQGDRFYISKNTRPLQPEDIIAKRLIGATGNKKNGEIASKSRMKTRTTLLSSGSKELKVNLSRASCSDANSYICANNDIPPGYSQVVALTVVDNGGEPTMRAESTTCSTCTRCDSTTPVFKVGEAFTVSCMKSMPFPRGNDRPNTFKWAIQRRGTDGKDYFKSVDRIKNRITNYNPPGPTATTTTKPGETSHGCLVKNSKTSTLAYTPSEKDHREMVIKCTVEFNWGGLRDTKETTMKVCIDGGTTVPTVTPTAGAGHQNDGTLGAGAIAGIVIVVIAAVVLVIVLIYFLWYKKRKGGKKYNANTADKNAGGDDYKPEYSDTYDNDPNTNGFKSKSKKPVPKPRSKNDHLHYAELELVRQPARDNDPPTPRVIRTDQATPYAQIQIT